MLSWQYESCHLQRNDGREMILATVSVQVYRALITSHQVMSNVHLFTIPLVSKNSLFALVPIMQSRDGQGHSF